MNLKKILKEEATWDFLALAGLWILLYMGSNVIIDTYFYMISLNILILLFSYIILKIKNKMHYYSYVVGCAFFVVWLIFYIICDLKSRSFERLSLPNNSQYCFIFQQVLKEGGQR